MKLGRQTDLVRLASLLAFALLAVGLAPWASATWNLHLAGMHKIADNAARPSWSPAGNDKIAFERKGGGGDSYYDLWVTNVDGSHQSCLTCSPPPGFPSRNAGNPSWHPSGNYLLLNAQKQNHPGAGQSWMDAAGEPGIGRNNDIWLIRANGSEAWLLWENPTPQSIYDPQPGAYNGRFSRDGTKIAWTHVYGGGGNWGDFVIRVARFYLTPTPHIDPSTMVEYDPFPTTNFKEVHGWSADGQRLAISGNFRGQHEFDGDPGLLKLATGQVTNLMASPVNTWVEAAQLHPEGEKVFFMSSEGYSVDYGNSDYPQWLKTDYWMTNANGTGRERVTWFNKPGHPEYNGDRVNVAAFDWNPEGSKFVGSVIRNASSAQLWIFEFAVTTEPCIPGATDLCLNDNRFRVEVTWRDHQDETGSGQAVPLSGNSGLFWFFNSSNLELLVKVLNGCAVNDRYWVYAAGTTDVEYWLTVTDTSTGAQKTYHNPLGTASPAITDSDAFDTCP